MDNSRDLNVATCTDHDDASMQTDRSTSDAELSPQGDRPTLPYRKRILNFRRRESHSKQYNASVYKKVYHDGLKSPPGLTYINYETCWKVAE